MPYITKFFILDTLFIVVQDFDVALSRPTAEVFVRVCVCVCVHAVRVHVGADGTDVRV